MKKAYSFYVILLGLLSIFVSIQPADASKAAAANTAAKVSAFTKVYYGPSPAYAVRGTFAFSKTVDVLAREGSWYHIEYWVNGGKVRAYVPGSTLQGSLAAVPAASPDIKKFGINVSKDAAVVYGGPDSSKYVSIGSIDCREIITVLQADGSAWYLVEYYTSKGLKRGYVKIADTTVPGLGFNYTMPIRTGTRTTDYSASHKGIDISTRTGTPVYAIAAGTAKFRTAYEVVDGKTVVVSYGHFIELTFNGKKAYYGHLSAFAGGITVRDLPNAVPRRGAGTNTGYIEYGTIRVNKNALLGYSGNTGNAVGSHFHFEWREGGKAVDPFTYVLFARMPK